MSFYENTYPGSAFLSDNWETWANEIAETAARFGASFEQCHAPHYHFSNPALSEEEKTFQQTLVLRSFECCRIWGAKTIVTHPDTRPEGSSAEQNRAFHAVLLAHAVKNGQRLAWKTCTARANSCVDPQELIDYIDSFSDARIGVCWDFEHGTIEEMDQPPIIRRLGKRLIATHVPTRPRRPTNP
jgi:sugar phosphate isomerase/epimerase